MNKFIPLCFAAGTACGLLTGCASTRVTRVDPNSNRPIVSMNKISLQELNDATDEAIKKMLDEFINSANLQSVDGPGKPAVIAISRIVNDTGQQLDVEIGTMVKKIRLALHQTGKVLTDVTGGLGGPEDPLMDAWKRQEVFKSGGTIRPPDYALSGRIFEKKERAGNIRQVTYVFQLSLASRAGLAVWEGQELIVKQGKTAAVGI